MREIALDTETTGLNPKDNHRIIEIGCVELINRIPSGRKYHQYINPERDVPPGAYAVSGLSYNFLKDFPTFDKIAHEFFNFINGAKLVIHNAAFDTKFINSEFERVNLPLVNSIDTLCTVALSRKKFPGQAANLDAICKRFGIDLSKRTKHGALIDAELLAQIYIELTGGKQFTLFNSQSELNQEAKEKSNIINIDIHKKQIAKARNFTLSDEEIKEHQSFVKTIKSNIWNY